MKLFSSISAAVSLLAFLATPAVAGDMPAGYSIKKGHYAQSKIREPEAAPVPKKERLEYSHLPFFEIEGLSTEDMDDEIMIVHFFATWCGGYGIQHSMLKEVSEAYDVPLYGINVLMKEQNESEDYFAQKYPDGGKPYKKWGKDQYRIISQSLNLVHATEIAVITKDRTIHWYSETDLTEDKVRDELIPVLKYLKHKALPRSEAAL